MHAHKQTHTHSFGQSGDLWQPALRIPRLSCMLTHEAEPGCAVRTNLLWTSLRQTTAKKLQHTLPPVNWLSSITAAAAVFASLSFCWYSLDLVLFLLLFTARATLTRIPFYQNPPPKKAKSLKLKFKDSSSTKCKANLITGKQVCQQVANEIHLGEIRAVSQASRQQDPEVISCWHGAASNSLPHYLSI